MLDSRSCRGFGAACALVLTVLSACAVPDYGTAEEPASAEPKKGAAPKEGAQPGDQIPVDPVPGTAPDVEKPAGATNATCTNECATEGAKRCSPTSNSGTEMCAKATDGCRKWSLGGDCPTDFSCDKMKNDGTCLAGCTSDPGCGATNAGVAHCAADGKSELTCTKVGACYVFKTTRTGILQQCTTPLYCGPTTGRRINCVVTAVGACMQHVATFNDCPAGTVCTGLGQCTASAPACTNACTLNAARCVAGAARSRQVCVTGSTGCTVWATGTSCSPSETCTNGVCN